MAPARWRYAHTTLRPRRPNSRMHALENVAFDLAITIGLYVGLMPPLAGPVPAVCDMIRTQAA
jgi:hypothetical protein